MTVTVAGAASAASSPLSALHVIGDGLQASTVELHAETMGRAHGLGADALERLGIVVAELAANIVQHAGTGQIILRLVGEAGSGCVEVLALDKGPGLPDMARAMRDPGSDSGARRRDAGLGGVKRLANLFDIYSPQDRGTAVVVHVGTLPGQDPQCCDPESILHGRLGVVCVPLRGEEECGDAWAVETASGRVVMMLVDGLGHGPQAAIAARAALSVFPARAPGTIEASLNAMNLALHTTRGAALSMATVDPSRKSVRFGGVGNVDGRVVTVEMSRHLVPQNGIVGHTMPKPNAVEMPWPDDARLVMHSDGISSRWNANAYPGLLARHPALLAGVLFRDFARARDDATVIVLRDIRPVAGA